MNFSLPILLEIVVKSSAILLASALALKAWQGASAAQRHMVWLAALVTVLLVPLALLLPTPRLSISLPGNGAAAAVPQILNLPAIQTSAQILSATAPALRAPARAAFPWRHAALAVWATGACGLIGYRLLGSQRLRVIKRWSVPLDDDRIAASLAKVVAEFQISQPIELRVSEQCRVPVTWGTLRPVLMLPLEAIEWNDARFTAALRHEAGHIRRHDYCSRWIAQIVCALYWPNLLVWLAARRLRAAQEQACDDLVLCAGTSAEEYAAQLVEAARSVASGGFIASCAVAMAQPSTLEGRFRSIVDASRNRQPVSARTSTMAWLLGGLALLSCSMLSLHARDAEIPATSKLQADDKRIERIKAKLNQIMIPGPTFRHASVHEVLEYLRTKSVELDTEEPDPAKRGVNFVLELKPSPQPAGWAPEAEVVPHVAKITLSLEGKVPLMEALRYATQLEKLKFRIRPDAVVIVPLGTPEELVIREYKVTRALLDVLMGKKVATPESKKNPDVKTFLMEMGIAFPPGATATYLASSGVLIVRNSEDNQELIKIVIEAAAKS